MAIQRTIDLLEYIDKKGCTTVKDVSAQLGLPVHSTADILNGLAEYGILRHMKFKQYSLASGGRFLLLIEKMS